ncbi:MAG: Lrp/AsnC ligand binding domain-containing protein [Nitrososphaerales archaeon]
MPTAYVMMTCDLGYEEEIIKQLSKLKGVTKVCGTYGVYDIVAEVSSDSMDLLRQTITVEMTKIPHIRSKVTLIVIEGQGQVTKTSEYR